MRAVFDTNVVVSALLFAGRLAWLRVAWADNRLLKVVSYQTVAELRRVLDYPKFRLTDVRRGELIKDYIKGAEYILPSSNTRALTALCRDPKDAMLITLAATANVPLITGDKDLLVLKGILPFEILTMTELHAIIV